jgi:hypothetical protein
MVTVSKLNLSLDIARKGEPCHHGLSYEHPLQNWILWIRVFLLMCPDVHSGFRHSQQAMEGLTSTFYISYFPPGTICKIMTAPFSHKMFNASSLLRYSFNEYCEAFLIGLISFGTCMKK